jgi:hypothetical protein
MATRADIQAQITPINSALTVLRQQLLQARPGSAGQTQLSIQIFDLEQQLKLLVAKQQSLPSTSPRPVPPQRLSELTTLLPGVGASAEGDVGEAEARAQLAAQVSNIPLQPPGVGASAEGDVGEAEARAQLATSTAEQAVQLAPVPTYIAQQDPEGDWAVYDLSTGLAVRSGISEQEAQLAAQDLNVSGEVQQRPAPANQTLEQQAEYEAAKSNTLRQAALQARYKQPSNNDWRVRIQLAAGSNYLYNAPGDKGILAPLAPKDGGAGGVVFPYTPNIEMSYKADYSRYDLVHSNFRGVFYKNSTVEDISVRGEFTAQDSSEAAYLLAVIHFFRSVTKMFYGKDVERGSPPPLVYLTGLGDMQFAGHPCVVSNFSYSLPSNVDYIRANSFNNYGTDLLNRRNSALSPGSSYSSSITRLINSELNIGAEPRRPVLPNVTQSVNNTSRASYVPTKIEINVTLIPVQSRDQVSKDFSLKDFATGNLLNKGFW